MDSVVMWDCVKGVEYEASVSVHYKNKSIYIKAVSALFGSSLQDRYIRNTYTKGDVQVYLVCSQVNCGNLYIASSRFQMIQFLLSLAEVK